MTLEEILLSAKEKAQRSAGQWLKSEYQRKGTQHIPGIEAKVRGIGNIIEVALLMQGDIKDDDVPIITKYSRRFVVDMLGYLKPETLRNIQKVRLLADKKIGERVIPIFYHEYGVERTDTRHFQVTIGGTVFPIIRRYDPADTQFQSGYPDPQTAASAGITNPEYGGFLRTAAGAIRDLFNAVRHAR